MYSNAEINQLVNLVVEETNPDKVILFGSYAYGNPNDNSDLDLLVIKNGKDFTVDDEAKLATDIFYKRRQLGIKIRYDIFYRTECQVQQSVQRGGAFVDALQKGKVVYVRGN